MASFNTLKNMLVLAFDWMLYSVGAADNCQVTVTQPRFQDADYSTHSVLLTCTFSASGCSSSPPKVLWFRFLAKKHEDLCIPECRDHQKYKVYLSGNNTSLQINNLTVADSAVYICGIAFSDSSSPHSKQTGDGTVLTKTENQHSNGKPAFLVMVIASSSLFLYSTTIITFFVIYKKITRFGNILFKWDMHKITSGRKVFQAIAQELQKQRYAEHWQQP
ncbi:IGSF6 protein, partial [Rhinopomastus cyanomelas]|nr:IGSF6 protein [Rhinopomastus cyanomelas]